MRALMLLLLLGLQTARLLMGVLQQEPEGAGRQPAGGCQQRLPGWGAAAKTSGRGWPRWGAGSHFGGSHRGQMLGWAGDWGCPRK